MNYIDKIKENIANLEELLKKETDPAEKKFIEEELIQAKRILDKAVSKSKQESTQASAVTPTDNKGDNIVFMNVKPEDKPKSKASLFISKILKFKEKQIVSREAVLSSQLATFLEVKELILLDLTKDIQTLFKDRYGITVDVLPTKANELKVTLPNHLSNKLNKDNKNKDMQKALDSKLRNKHDLVYLVTPNEQGFTISLATTQEELDDYTVISDTPEALNDGIIYLETKRRLSRIDRVYKLMNNYIKINKKDEHKVKELIKQRLSVNPAIYLKIIRDPSWFFNFAEDIFLELGYMKEDESLAEYTKRDVKKTKSKANTLLDSKFIWVFTVLDQRGDTIKDNIFGIDEAITEFISHEEKAALLVAYPYIDPNPEDANVELVFADNPGPIILYDNEKATIPKDNINKDLSDKEKELIDSGEADLGKHQLEQSYRVANLRSVLNEWVELDIEEIKLLDENDIMVLANRLDTVLVELYELQDTLTVDEDGNTGVTLEYIINDLSEKANYLNNMYEIPEFQESTMLEDSEKPKWRYPGNKGPKPAEDLSKYDAVIGPGDVIPNPRQLERKPRNVQPLGTMKEVVVQLKSFYDDKMIAGSLSREAAKELKELLIRIVDENKANEMRAFIMSLIRKISAEPNVEQEVINYLLEFGAFVGQTIKPIEMRALTGLKISDNKAQQPTNRSKEDIINDALDEM